MSRHDWQEQQARCARIARRHMSLRYRAGYVVRALFGALGIRLVRTGNGGGQWLHLRLWGIYTPGVRIPWH